MAFHVICVHITFGSVSIAEWPPFGKNTICSPCILTICNISFFPVLVLRAGFGF